MRKTKLIFIGLMLFSLSQLGTILAAWIVTTRHLSASYSIGLFLVFCILTVLFIKKAQKLALLPQKIKLRKNDFSYSFLALLMILLTNHFVQMLFPAPISENQQSLLADINLSFLPVALVILTAPLFEEIIFRGILFDQLFHQSSIGLLSQAILFAILHIIPEIQEGRVTVASFVSYLIPAVVFAWINKKTNRLETAILAHFLNNAIPLVLIVVLQLADVKM